MPVKLAGATPITVRSRAADPHAAADDAGVGVEPFGPRGVRQHDHRIAARRLVLVVAERAAERPAGTPSTRKKLPLTPRPRTLLRRLLGAQREAGQHHAVGEQAFEAARAVAHVAVVEDTTRCG